MTSKLLEMIQDLKDQNQKLQSKMEDIVDDD